MPWMEASFRLLRIVHYAMLLSIVLYAFFAIAYGPPPRLASGIIFPLLAGVAVLLAVAAVVMRGKMIRPYEELLPTAPGDKGALRRWQSGYIFIFALCEAIAIYGVVLRFIGFSSAKVLPFFVSGFVLMLLFRPKQPSSTIG